ncbi:MAG: hypothetical protein AAF992_17695 [Bacteroidota bacterium]
MKNSISIPSFLHEIHGERSNWFDLALTHLIALAATLAVLTQTSEFNFAGWERWTLIALTYDLAGGIIANFSHGTSDYYAQSNKRRLWFISLHFLQPLFMSILFPEFGMTIAMVSGYVIAASLAVNTIRDTAQQATVGSLLAVGGIIALQIFLPETTTVLELLLTMFLLKLPLAFAVRWTNPKEVANKQFA